MPRHNPAEQNARALRAIVITIAVNRLSESLHNESSKRVPLSSKGEAEGKGFEHLLNKLRVREEKARRLLGDNALEKLLCGDPLTLPKSSGDRPATLEEMEAFTTKHESLAYVITEKHEFTYLSETALRLMTFGAVPGSPLDELNMRIAGNLLPKESFSRNPQQDYLLLQRMLGTLARTGAYQIPKISLLIRMEDKDNSQVSHHEVTVTAEHCFTPEREKQLLGTICQVTGLETNIKPEKYETALRKGELIPLLLPEDLTKMVESRLQLLQKALRDARDETRLRLIELENEIFGLPFSLDTLNQQEIESLTVREFLQAIRNTQKLETLMWADDLADQAIKATQMQIKKEVKKSPYKIQAKGKISLRMVVQTYETKTDGLSSYGRFQADYTDSATGKNTSKQIRHLTEDEAREIKGNQRRKQSHQPDAAVTIDI